VSETDIVSRSGRSSSALQDAANVRAMDHLRVEHRPELPGATNSDHGTVDPHMRQDAALARIDQRLSLLASKMRRRHDIEQGLLEALAMQKDLRARLTGAEGQVVALSNMLDEVREVAAANTVRLQQELEASQTALKDVSNELKGVKRKYRATQNDLEKARRRHAVAAAQLDEARLALAKWRSSPAARSAAWLARTFSPGKWRTGASKRAKARQAIHIVRESDLFDADWYLARYPDVAAAGLDPAEHFVLHGWREGREPGPNFSTTAYLKAHDDVASAGINPLLHYLEHGRSEGRETVSFVPAAPRRSTEDFGPPAPCPSFPIIREEPIFWLRHYRLAPTGGQLLTIDGTACGVMDEADAVPGIATAIAQFRALSGLEAAEESVAESAFDNAGSDASRFMLTDSWFVGGGRLRTRWQRTGSSEPFVVRAFQRSSHGDVHAVLAGEALIANELDVADLALGNPWLPVLLIFTDPIGAVLGARHLAFPSLCRGGGHYSELLALAPAQSGPQVAGVDTLATMERLATRMLRILDGATEPLVASIAVDLSGADGTHPLFQSAFQTWLTIVTGTRLRPEPGSDESAGANYLAGAACAEPSSCRRKSGADLLLPGDAIPTIGILAAAAGDAIIGERGMSLLVARSDPALSATLMMLPKDPYPSLDIRAPGHARPFPVMRGCATDGSIEAIAAIRLAPSRNLTESDLLVPLAQPFLPTGLPVTVPSTATFIVSPVDWDEDILPQSLKALSLQRGAEYISIAIAGEVSRSTLMNAQRLFPGRCTRYATWRDAVEAATDPLIGQLGPGIILHDDRTVLVLTGLLLDERCVTASSVVVTSEKRGKTWYVAPADVGKIPQVDPDRAHAPPSDAHVARLLWRSVYPVARPPRDLWLARRDSVRHWGQSSAEPVVGSDEFHLCTSLVTASYASPRGHRDPPVRLPQAPHQHALQTRVLVG